MSHRRVCSSVVTAVIIMCSTWMTTVGNAAVRQPTQMTNKQAIVSRDSTAIGRNQTVEDVLVIGNDVTVAGDVSEILVVLDGNVHLKSTARADIVVDLGGTIRRDDGARVNAVYHASLDTPFWNGTMFGIAMALLMWVAMLAVAICLVGLSVLLCLAFRRSVQVPLGYVERSVRRTGLTGVLMSLAFMGIGAVTAMTIVGLPITVVLLVIYLMTGIVGFSIVSLWIGRLALRHSARLPANWLVVLLGASLITAFTMIPFVGLLLFLLLWLVGIGTATGWAVQSWKSRWMRRR